MNTSYKHRVLCLSVDIYLVSLPHEAGLRRGKVLLYHLPPSSPDQPTANVTLKLLSWRERGRERERER